MISRREVLSLYKYLMRESQKFPAYNFRKYALRRIHDGFKKNKTLNDPLAIEVVYKEGQMNLGVIKRQAIIGHLYSSDKLVIENVS